MLSLSQLDNELSFFGTANGMVAGVFDGAGKDAMQIQLRTSQSYSVYLIVDSKGISFITDKSGSNVVLGKVTW